MGAYTRTDSKKPQGAKPSSRRAGTEEDTFKKEDGFKKGGRAKKAMGGCGVMSSAAKPARASGGGILSSAHAGAKRGSTPKPY
jgi:hypothetical protein